MDLGSLLGALSDQDPKKQGESGDPLSDMLGALLGGASQGSGQSNAPAQGGDEILGSLSGGVGDAPMLGESGAPTGNVSAGGDPMSDLLGALLGGAGAQGGTTPASASGDPMSDLLGSLLGGGAPQAGGQGADAMGGMLGGLLGGMLGGGMSGASPNAGAVGGMGGMNAILAPLADLLSEKLGISREIAMAAMAILVPMLLNKLMSSGQQSGGDPLGGLGGMQRQGFAFTPDEQNEMVQQLSAQTGLDADSSAYTLNQAMQVLGSQH